MKAAAAAPTNSTTVVGKDSTTPTPKEPVLESPPTEEGQAESSAEEDSQTKASLPAKKKSNTVTAASSSAESPMKKKKRHNRAALDSDQEASPPSRSARKKLRDDKKSRGVANDQDEYEDSDGSSDKAKSPARKKKQRGPAKKKKSPSTPSTEVAEHNSSGSESEGSQCSPTEAVHIASCTAAAKEAVNDIRPHTKGREPFLYWSKDGKDAAERLLRRTKTLRRMASHMADGAFIRRYAKLIRDEATKEMNAQIRNLRELFLCNKYPDTQLVMNCLQAECKNGDMCLAPAMTKEFNTVDELMSIITSNEMYQYPALYDSFCRALEKGKLRETERCQPQPLQNMLTIAHEAHFRCEVASCMERQSYRHGLGVHSNADRDCQFKQQCILVEEDRTNNGAKAWKIRKAAIAKTGEEEKGSDSEDGGGGGVELDSRFY